MKANKTEIIFVCDRSGSMQGIKEATEKGFGDFIKKQQKEPGECYVSFYEFDDKFNTVFEYRNIHDVSEYILVPRGWTALLDAIGFTVNKVGDRLNNTPESEKPENVIVVILTDGMENRSKEFNREQVKKMVEHQQNKYNWKFIFLGSNQDAVLVGKTYGFNPDLSMTYSFNAKSAVETFKVLSSGASCLRNTITKDYYCFSDSDRKSVVEV